MKYQQNPTKIFLSAANEACCVCGGGTSADNDPIPACQDSDEKFLVDDTRRTCKWASFDTDGRCTTSAVTALCPVTCGTVCAPYDTVGRYQLPNGKLKTCNWAAKRPKKRCRNYVTRANCPVTCGIGLDL